MQKAISLYRKAIENLPKDSPELSAVYQGLSSSLLHRFLKEKEKRKETIDKSVQYARQAVKLTDPVSADNSRYQITLANCLQARFEHTGDLADLKDGINAYRVGCNVGRNGLPLATLAAAQNWGKWAFQRQDWQGTIEALSYARPIIEDLVQIQTSREYKENWLGQTDNLYTLLAYALVRTGKLTDAVEAIEQGRAQLMREALERQRRDFERLIELGFKELHDSFQTSVNDERTLQSTSPKHRKEDWLIQIDTIRRKIQVIAESIRNVVGEKHPEYRFFLRTLPFDEIQKQAKDAALVYLFVTAHGGIALVVRFDGQPQVIELPELTDQTLWNRVIGSGGAQSYIKALFDWRGHLNDPIYFENWKQVLDGTLAWMWQVAMGPLSFALGVEANITLIPCGLLALLPWHAAWHPVNDATLGRNYFLDQVTVSFAPSARALYHDQARLRTNQLIENLLVITNPSGELTDSQDVVKIPQSLFKNSCVLQKESAKRETVLDKLADYDVIYFFTHGLADFDDPLNSGLSLAEGEKITLRDFVERNIDRVRLVVLSACESGFPADLKRLDEVVSLPSGLMQSGIPGVLGSYWPVSEISTAILITIFFEQWRKYGLSIPAALRRAQIILRDASNDASARNYVVNSISQNGESTTISNKVLDKVIRFGQFEHPFFWAGFAFHGI